MDAVNLPSRAPTSSELLNHPVVRQALDQAWLDSQTEEPLQRHEEGGWIYMDTQSGQLTIKRSQIFFPAAIDLSSPPIVSGSVVVAKFHTHPQPSAEGWNPGPSPADQTIDARNGVPDLIRAVDGVHVSGPQSRRGGLGGGPGFPA